eukprot:287510-Ditylum_brightwellii.AAC.1
MRSLKTSRLVDKDDGRYQDNLNRSNTNMTDHQGGSDMTSQTTSSASGIGLAQRKEIYTYKAPWTVFAMAWSNR